MNLKIEETDERYLVTLEGNMDSPAVLETEELIEPVYKGDKDVVIDCSHLNYIASSGLRVLLSIRQGTGANGKSVVIRGLNDEIKNVFKMTGFINLFTLVD
ncbi:MAG: STAS domain-containing protein [Prevotella sp.]|nr:STAS domain-containing protein [Prevotella sp.]MBR0262946.1 STAS domain-containing protein [Prevotella sp.]